MSTTAVILGGMAMTAWLQRQRAAEKKADVALKQDVAALADVSSPQAQVVVAEAEAQGDPRSAQEIVSEARMNLWKLGRKAYLYSAYAQSSGRLAYAQGNFPPGERWQLEEALYHAGTQKPFAAPPYGAASDWLPWNLIPSVLTAPVRIAEDAAKSVTMGWFNTPNGPVQLPVAQYNPAATDEPLVEPPPRPEENAWVFPVVLGGGLLAAGLGIAWLLSQPKGSKAVIT